MNEEREEPVGVLPYCFRGCMKHKEEETGQGLIEYCEEEYV